MMRRIPYCLHVLCRMNVEAELDFLGNLNDMSPDPINEVFHYPISPSLISEAGTGPTSVWVIDWSRPLAATTYAY